MLRPIYCQISPKLEGEFGVLEDHERFSIAQDLFKSGEGPVSLKLFHNAAATNPDGRQVLEEDLKHFFETSVSSHQGDVIIAVSGHGNASAGGFRVGGSRFTAAVFWTFIKRFLTAAAAPAQVTYHLIFAQCYGFLFAKALQSVIQNDSDAAPLRGRLFVVGLSAVTTKRVPGDAGTVSRVATHSHLTPFVQTRFAHGTQLPQNAGRSYVCGRQSMGAAVQQYADMSAESLDALRKARQEAMKARTAAAAAGAGDAADSDEDVEWETETDETPSSPCVYAFE